MKTTITKTFTETHEVEITLPMFVKHEVLNDLVYYYALFEETKYIEVTTGHALNAIKICNLKVDDYIQLPQITEEEFLKAYAEANSVNVINYHKHFTKSNVFIEMVAGGNEE